MKKSSGNIANFVSTIVVESALYLVVACTWLVHQWRQRHATAHGVAEEVMVVEGIKPPHDQLKQSEMTGETSDYQTYEALISRHNELRSRTQAHNKETVFDALQAAGLASVTVEFDGSCDSGQIESIDGWKDDDSQVFVPETLIVVAKAHCPSHTVEMEQQTLVVAIETMTYDFLSNAHPGWENDDGAYGTFTFDVAERTISLDFNERYRDTKNYTDEF